jgi:hypothetical protein
VFWREPQKERGHYEYLDEGEKIISKWLLEIFDGMTWTGYICLRIGTSGGLL